MAALPNSSFEATRQEAARIANADDAQLWRWFCELFEEGRLRWCKAAAGWLVSVDHRHLSTEETFYDAVRLAKARFDSGVRRTPATSSNK
ncbi:hypothetical protein F3J20_11680 [Paraburkholderia sp. Cy-641]|nr:hypothetical protein [Paraburkholderia sp. Cy-641]